MNKQLANGVYTPQSFFLYESGTHRQELTAEVHGKNAAFGVKIRRTS